MFGCAPTTSNVVLEPAYRTPFHDEACNMEGLDVTQQVNARRRSVRARIIGLGLLRRPVIVGKFEAAISQLCDSIIGSTPDWSDDNSKRPRVSFRRLQRLKARPKIAVTYTANEFQGIYRGKKQHDEDFDEVIKRAEAVGCSKIMLTTMTMQGARQNLEVCTRWPKTCYMTIGVHPYHAAELYDGTTSLQELVHLMKLLMPMEKSPLVAFGEIGLDYFYLERAGKDVQQRAFLDQLEIATTFDLPLFLHVRDAYQDFVDLIRPYMSKLPQGGIIHSFVGTKEEMLGLVDLGFGISVNGVSFKTAEHLDMVRAIPLDKLQLETDAPWCEIPGSGPVIEYLSDAPPLPMSRKPGKFVRGQMVKGRNESCVIERVARVVAGVKGIPLEEVVAAAWGNSVDMFGLGVNE
ncbi:hypothetical protein LTR84_007204 [Exophiala bonariae]|uniref:Uncharacterized protein n=1 Tax=Exophiala bonariae TaxID=1690606 RepID=A0AAV9MZX1_9EURO|nr:hypothetical protein LTR84_007204 [Exophiala bonariae]